MTGFAEFHGELRAVARDVLGAEPGAAPAWEQLVAAGWAGLEVPEALGGAGVTFAETAVVVEELGRAAATTPYLGVVALGVGALNLVEPGPERDALLTATAAGDARPVLVRSGDAAPSSAPHSTATFVLDAADATVLLVPVAGADGRPALAVVDPASPDVTLTPQPVLDATRSLATVDVGERAVDGAPVLVFAADPERALGLLRDRAAVAVALDGLGLAGAMLDATVAYATVREQFGRPIGSFQAVKHQCADMAVQLAVGRELVEAAVAAVAAAGTGEDAAACTEASTAAAMSAAYVGDAAVAVVGTALQLHGGIGYTWESGVHVFLKRATLDRSLFGSPAAHRGRLAERYGSTPVA